MPKTYADSGVDVNRGYDAVKKMKSAVSSTFNKNVLGDIGSFGGFYSIEDYKYDKPVLVAGTDGVGTKLKYAFALNRFDTVGIDCVAMCVNDIVCQGAKPLLFLDYIATGRIDPDAVAKIVEGIAKGCRETGCALIGGETAEMPGFYVNGEFDLAGFSVGIVDRDKIINGKTIKKGDVLVGLASSGIHSNGFSLVRKIFHPDDKALLATYYERLGNTLGEVLLTPTRLYVNSVLALKDKFNIKGIAHITGGGFIENIPRILPDKDKFGIKINTKSYELPEIFKMLVEEAELPDRESYNTFNMGIGLVCCIDAKDATEFIKQAEALGEKAYVIGEITDKSGVELL